MEIIRKIFAKQIKLQAFLEKDREELQKLAILQVISQQKQNDYNLHIY